MKDVIYFGYKRSYRNGRYDVAFTVINGEIKLLSVKCLHQNSEDLIDLSLNENKIIMICRTRENVITYNETSLLPSICRIPTKNVSFHFN